MIFIINIIFLMLISQIISQALREFVSFDPRPTPIDMTAIWKIRCTRRFSPGTCQQQVAPVWTYQFHLQNCTERLGCPQAWRSNRFNNYTFCMTKCKYMIDLYSYIISSENNNFTSHILRENADIPSGGRDNVYSDVEYPQYQQTDREGDSSLNYMYRHLEGDADGVGEVNLDYEGEEVHYNEEP